jgi:simple sugar transport system ATP-binding protein
VDLVIKGLSWQPVDQFACGLVDLDLEARSGEVLGIAGIAGNGQSELMDMLTGEVKAPSSHVITFQGQPIGHLGPQARRKLGMCFAPEERLGHGAVPAMELWENAFLSGFARLGLVNGGMMKIDRTKKFAGEVIEAFAVKTTGEHQEAESLSGGNLQKFVIGREILQKPEVMIALQPTWGVDAGSAAAIRQALIDLAQEGAAVIVISQDLDELFEMSTRIAVITEGRLTEPKPAGQVSIEEIGMTMGGLHDLGGPEGSKAHG